MLGLIESIFSVSSGVALMLRARSVAGSSLLLILTQLLQGTGGGITALSIQVSAQAAVASGDVAMATADNPEATRRMYVLRCRSTDDPTQPFDVRLCRPPLRGPRGTDCL